MLQINDKNFLKIAEGDVVTKQSKWYKDKSKYLKLKLIIVKLNFSGIMFMYSDFIYTNADRFFCKRHLVRYSGIGLFQGFFFHFFMDMSDIKNLQILIII